MTRVGFLLSSVFIGVFLQVVMGRYLSLFDVEPQILLLLSVANGFVCGPILGELIGFFCGLLSDASGVRLFGMNAFLLMLAGYLGGQMRRRVASERLTAQLVIGLVATVLYTVGAQIIYGIFEEPPGRFSFGAFVLKIIYNLLFVSLVFSLAERWVNFWNVKHD